MHVGSLDPTFVQNFRPVPLTVFDIQGFKLKNKNDNNDKKNWRNRLFAISSMFAVKFSPNFRCTYILILPIILRCQKSESESVNPKFQMDLVHPYHKVRYIILYGWTRSWPIMPVHLKILICTFTFSEPIWCDYYYKPRGFF